MWAEGSYGRESPDCRTSGVLARVAVQTRARKSREPQKENAAHLARADSQLELEQSDFQSQGFLNIRVEKLLSLFDHMQILHRFFRRDSVSYCLCLAR